jgi:CubicO group peptidase (beta-lactamase class C family)
MSLKRLFWLLLGLVVTVDLSAEDTAPSKALVAAVDRLVAKIGIDATSPGVAILIRVPGRLLFQKGYGLANLAQKTRITPGTVFELASCSKPFTATAVLLLHDRGLLSIEDDVRDYIPELPEYDSETPILIRDLLQHTSGLPEYFDFEDVPRRNKTCWVNEDYLSQFAAQQADFPLQFRPGSKYDYCNSNFLLLASLVQRVAKKSLGRFLHDEIFVPAGMEHTFVYDSPQEAPQITDPRYSRAIGYEWNEKRENWKPGWGTPPDRQEKVLVVGDGSVWSNLEDMAKWDSAVRTRKFLKPETWKLALTSAKTRKGKNTGYGLGWFIYAEDDDQVYGVGHDGTWGGFENSYYRHLRTNRSTVILSNHDTMDTDELWTALDELVEKHLTRE